MRKILVILIQIISWIIFPPVFIYSVFMSNKINKVNKTLCSISVLFSPFTIIFLSLLWGHLYFPPHTIEKMEKNIGIEISNDFEILKNNRSFVGATDYYDHTIELLFKEESIQVVVKNIEKTKYFNFQSSNNSLKTLNQENLGTDFYIIATDIASNENEASEKVNKLKAAGYASDYLWIPDYKSLSGAEYFSVFIGPFRSESECAIAVQEYRKNNPSAYGLLVSNESSKRVSITGPNKIKITEGSNIKKFNIQAKEKIITFNEATDFMQKRSKNIDQTTKYLELKTYLKQNHLTGFWIKKDFNTYVFHEPNLKSLKELWSTDNSWGKNAPILFNERWTITAKVLKNERKIKYTYSTF